MNLIERFGYVLSELPVLFFITWFAVRWVQLHRKRRKMPLYTEKDRQILRRRPEYTLRDLKFYPRFVLAVLAVTVIGVLECIFFASAGAAILTGILLLTSAVIVQNLLFSDA